MDDRILAGFTVMLALGGVWAVAENATGSAQVFMAAVVMITLFRVAVLR